MTLTNRFLLPYGTENVAALGIALKVNMIVMLIMVGFAFGPSRFWAITTAQITGNGFGAF